MSFQSDCFCLCLDNLDDCTCPDPENCAKCSDNCCQPEKKKKRLSLKVESGKSTTKGKQRKQEKEPQRFDFLDDNDFEKMKDGYKPINTDKSTKWAVNNFKSWKDARKEAGQETCPDDLLLSSDPKSLSTWLAKFAAETRTTKGKPYPPSTLYHLLTGLLRYMRDSNPDVPNFLDKKDRRFSVLHKSLDKIFRDLRTNNIGTTVKHAEIFTAKEEDMLWEKEVLGTHSPKALLNAVFYFNGKNFCLRGGEEHRCLALSQICRQQNPDSYVYTELGSKNHKGTFTERNIPNKVVPIFSSRDLGDRCHVHILDMYYSKLPKEAFERDIFYLRPLPVCPKDPNAPWFMMTPIGRNELGKMVKSMCMAAGIEGNKTNHSLRATAASQLFVANVPEKVIAERTGHRSVTALRVYEHTTGTQHQIVSDILGSKRSTFEESVPKPETELPKPTSVNQPPFSINMQGCTVTFNMGQSPAMPLSFPTPMPPPQLSMPHPPPLDWAMSDDEMHAFLSDP